MAVDDILVWLVGFSCAGLVVRAVWTDRGHMNGWLGLALVLLGITLGGFFTRHRAWVIAGEIGWLLLVVVPSLLSGVYLRLNTAQRFGAARRAALLMKVLHPGDGWRELPEMMRALKLAQQGREDEALRIFDQHERRGGANGVLAAAQLFRITGRWEEFMVWRKAHVTGTMMSRFSGLLPLVLRGFGETGDLEGMLAWYQQFATRMDRLPASTRSFCRLTVYAFCGRRDEVELLFENALSQVPAGLQKFWIATSMLAAGEHEEGRRLMESLAASPDHLLRAATLRRLDHPPPQAAQVLSPAGWAVLSSVEHVDAQEDRFASRPGLWTREARCTVILIALNVAVFALEMGRGGSMNAETLDRLGAVSMTGLKHGEWWRLGASLFLHAGPVHVAMNMLALAWLGPFVERALGRPRFLMLYLLAGLGSSGAAVLQLARGSPDESLVGASGSIMGLIGATAAMAWRGWRQERARPAGRQLRRLVIAIAAQTLFDVLTPQVSFTAHGSGVLLGFLIASCLRHRGDSLRRLGPAAS